MIERIDRKLTEWVGDILGDVKVWLGAPEKKDTDTVGVYLTDILPSSPAHVTRRAPLQVMLCYLLTVWSEEPLEAHKMLSRLIFAAMEHPEFEVDLAEVPAQTWSAFGIKPRPSFKIRLPLRVERTDLTTHRVRGPMEIRRTSISAMEGIVIGPADQPIDNARISLPACKLITTTDSRGRFAFESVPLLSQGMLKLHVEARGREVVREIASTEMIEEKLIIHIDL